MLSWAIVFLIMTLVAAVFGFSGLAVASVTVAKGLFVVFIVLFLVALVAGARQPPA